MTLEERTPERPGESFARRHRLTMRWPTQVKAPLAENVFVGAWSAESLLDVDVQEHNDQVRQLRRGANWIMFGARSPLHADHPSLLHECADRDLAVAFRGYVLEPPIHSYSSGRQILNYWQTPRSLHNGVFAAALVTKRGRELNLISDALGISPLYYRQIDGLVLFATNPLYLAMPADRPDLLAWRCRIQAGFIPSDLTMTEGIKRVPAGARIVFSQQSTCTEFWHAPEDFPSGCRKVTRESVGEVEACFRQAMQRCLSLQSDSLTLPLSSGHDSRRILSALLAERADFDAMTVRVRQKDFRDLDATFASSMAKDLKFPHRIVEFASDEQYGSDSIDRLYLTGYETHAHTWVIRFMISLPERPTLLFDGLLGDILGNPGYRMPGMYQSSEQDLDLILADGFTSAFDEYLLDRTWPDVQQLRDETSRYLSKFTDKPNMPEFAFILLRQRRMTALWSHQFLPAGHVAVCPYLDLDYLRLLFDYEPAGKHATIFQRACLNQFWPQLAKYPGNRDIPAGMPAGNPSVHFGATVSHYRELSRYLHEHDDVSRYLTRRGRLLHQLAGISKKSAERWDWVLSPILELNHSTANRSVVWKQRPDVQAVTSSCEDIQ